MEERINDNSGVTANSKQVEVLKKHFPQCFDKHGKFMPKKLQEIVGDDGVELSKESYSLNWLGKSYARLLANENPRTWLAEDKEHNQKVENKNSENLLIKGDNLEVLKHLVNAYSEQVKMIYIDPPYNTGSDGFVYQDDRKFTVDELSRLAGIDKDEAKRILDFTQSKANSHSAWLTFMYPRLYVARELLQEDGVIFISIDDNEASQLKLLCDEVFGEENFAGTFVVNSTPNARNYGHVAKMHDYCIMYCKRTEYAKTFEVNEEREFKYKDSKSDFNIHPLYNSDESFHSENRPNLFYPFFLNPDEKDENGFFDISLEKSEQHTIEVFPPLSSKNKVQFVWRWSSKKAQENLNKEIIAYKTDTGEYRIVRKMRHTSKIIRSLLLDKAFSGRRGTAEVETLFQNKIFSFPKPVSLIETLCDVAVEDGDIVLDFFAGSGTTAHAVMNLNANDSGCRCFIAIQIPEVTDKKSTAYKAGYKTIFDITKARIEKAALKIKEEYSDYEGDLGFKIFESIQMPDGYLDDIDELDSQQPLFDGSKLGDEQLQHLLSTWKVNDGIHLTQELEPVILAKYTAWYFGKNLYLMHSAFTTDALKALIEMLDSDKEFCPAKVVLFGYNFDSKHQREIKEALSNYTNKKSIDVDVAVRH